MKNMFNIYYINNEKASEISMLFDNQIVEKITRIKNTELAMAGDGDVTTSAASNIPVIGQYLPSINLNGNLSHNRSNRVEDTVKVVSSKSTILKPIYEKAKEVRRLDDSKVGNLVKIKDVYLTVVNSDDVMATKALMSGLVNQVPIEGIGNMNFIQDSGMDIEDGIREEDKKGIRNISLAQGKVHYIDVIAIIQDINI